MEIWKDVAGYEGHYMVSNEGRIKTMKFGKEKIMANRTNSMGYVDIILTKNGFQRSFRLHRLIAEAFIENPEKLPVVNHLDSNKKNNNISNLEWSTYSHNNKHSYDSGNNKTIKITQLDKETGSVIKEWNSIKEASNKLNIDKSNIANCVRGKLKSAGGYKWTKR